MFRRGKYPEKSAKFTFPNITPSRLNQKARKKVQDMYNYVILIPSINIYILFCLLCWFLYNVRCASNLSWEQRCHPNSNRHDADSSKSLPQFEDDVLFLNRQTLPIRSPTQDFKKKSFSSSETNMANKVGKEQFKESMYKKPHTRNRQWQCWHYLVCVDPLFTKFRSLVWQNVLIKLICKV